jgi:hypothetical protein
MEAGLASAGLAITIAMPRAARQRPISRSSLFYSCIAWPRRFRPSHFIGGRAHIPNLPLTHGSATLTWTMSDR